MVNAAPDGSAAWRVTVSSRDAGLTRRDGWKSENGRGDDGSCGDVWVPVFALWFVRLLKSPGRDRVVRTLDVTRRATVEMSVGVHGAVCPVCSVVEARVESARAHRDVLAPNDIRLCPLIRGTGSRHAIDRGRWFKQVCDFFCALDLCRLQPRIAWTQRLQM